MIETANAATKVLREFYSNKPSSSCEHTPLVINDDDPSSILTDIDTVLFDCDGVLYQSQDPIPGAADCLEFLSQQGKKVLFVTNNAGVNRKQLRDKLSTVLDLDHLTCEQMVSSASVSAQYLRNQLLLHDDSNNSSKVVYVIGSEGLCQEIVEAGFTVLGGQAAANGSSSSPRMDRQELATYDFASIGPVDAVVVGHDTEFTFRKLSIASNLLLRNPRALLVATNMDSFDLVGSAVPPGDNDDDEDFPRHIPGNGCAVKALEYCSQRTAVDVGKPSRVLAEQIQTTHGLEDMSRCLFVGDRLDTDILFAKRTGMQSLLVMTGVTTAEQLVQLAVDGGGGGAANDQNDNNENLLPTYILPYIGRLVPERSGSEP